MKNRTHISQPVPNSTKSSNLTSKILLGALVVWISLIGGALIFGIIGGYFSPRHGGANRLKCNLQMEAIEKLVISHGRMFEIPPGHPFAPSILVEKEYLTHLPSCPSGGNYTYTGKMSTQKSGTLPFAQCDHERHNFSPYSSTIDRNHQDNKN